MNTVKRSRGERKHAEGSSIHVRINTNVDKTLAYDSINVKLPATANSIFLGTDKNDKPPLFYFPDVVVREMCADRPLHVFPNGYILLETNTPMVNTISNFLIAIAEPISRPLFIHEYQLTVFGLFAAMSMGITSTEILSRLDEYSKNHISPGLQKEIIGLGNAFGKLKLVLRDSKYFIESSYRNELELLMKCPTVAGARIEDSLSVREQVVTDVMSALNAETARREHLNEEIDSILVDAGDTEKEIVRYMDAMIQPVQTATDYGKTTNSDIPREKVITNTVYSFGVRESAIGAIKEAALHELGRPLLTEYDASKDVTNPTLDISLKQTTKVRYYQQRALRKMFNSGQARSGIIVLPCGAGKTLTGIAAATAIKKSTMVLTSNSVAVEQWRNSFCQFTSIDPSRVITLTSDAKTNLPEGACIVCTTYTMISYSGRRSDAAAQVMAQIRSRDWGLLIFDEVQFAPAPAFRKVTEQCRSHCKLGLTATLVREDNLINDLHWMIGPKLDEANWQELQRNGYLAKAKCCEVWCPMTLEFYRAFINCDNRRDRSDGGTDIQRRLWTCNPNKLKACEYLIKFHEARGDKIIVFSDYLMALKEVARTLRRPFVSGDVSLNERMMIINRFKNDPHERTIFLSKVGDNAIDIPCANVVIQISFNYASRRQETQRLGRILRPKEDMSNDGHYNAFFYSLASQDTAEMVYADRRQQYIVDQGYAYQIVTLDMLPIEGANLLFSEPARQKDLLQRILTVPILNEEEEDATDPPEAVA